MKSQGNYRMARGWLEHSLFGREVYCRRAAWVWLVEHAAFAPYEKKISGQTIQLKRGQLWVSVRFLAESWKWTTTRVWRFLQKLETETQIETRITIHGVTAPNLITICNYNKYQAPLKRDETQDKAQNETEPKQNISKYNQLNKKTTTAASAVVSLFDDLRAKYFGEKQRRSNRHESDIKTANKWLSDGLTLEYIGKVIEIVLARLIKNDSYPPDTLKYFNDVLEEHRDVIFLHVDVEEA